jgi:hypothetical protein
MVVLLVALLIAGGGGSGDLTFTRGDGSAAQFPAALRAWCGPFDEDNEDVEAVHVLAGEPPADASPDSFWILDTVRADVGGSGTTLPHTFNYTKPRGLLFFALDADDHENELSSAEEESSGTIRVESAGCEPGDSVRVTFDEVVVGSEYHDLQPISVAGTVVAEIGEPPNP